MVPGRRAWYGRCPECGFFASNLAPHIGDEGAAHNVDEAQREEAFIRLRRQNFEKILDLLRDLGGTPPREILEIGCAHGWFLERAAARHYTVSGIEPDAHAAAAAMSRGYDVAVGFFPEALDEGKRCDIIVFNDVFEHLPDVSAALDACREALRRSGLLVINLPNSHGALFRIASLLDILGLRGPHERLWQKDFPSPHLSYFHPHALARLVARHGFVEVHRGPLASVDLRGLWQRLRYDRRAGFGKCIILWCAIVLASPLLRVLPGDISLQILRTRD